jgi:hypothetical protein
MNINLVLWEIINESTGFIWYIDLCPEDPNFVSDVMLEDGVQSETETRTY